MQDVNTTIVNDIAAVAGFTDAMPHVGQEPVADTDGSRHGRASPPEADASRRSRRVARR